MEFERHIKVTLLRGKNINACTTFKTRTIVVAKASYKNLVYTTNKVEDMGLNPQWKDDGTNVFHFDYTNESEYITLELFNRNNDCIGESKLLFAELARLPPRKVEMKTLQVMSKKKKNCGELIVEVAIMEHKALGEHGLLTVKIREGFIQKLTSIFGSKTTKISAKLIYKHTTYTSRVLENSGNRFVWHEDNTFIFIINSFNSADILKLEVYNSQAKVGECEILMSEFIKEKHLQGVPSEEVSHSTKLSLPNKVDVGEIVVAAKFTSKITHRRSSFYHTGQSSTSHIHHEPVHFSQRPDAGFVPTAPRFDPRPAPEVYPSQWPDTNPIYGSPRPSPEFYPPAQPGFGGVPLSTPPEEVHPPRRPYPTYDPSTINHPPPVSGSYTPSAPVLSEDYVNVHGAPPGLREVNQDPQPDEEMQRFMNSFH